MSGVALRATFADGGAVKAIDGYAKRAANRDELLGKAGIYMISQEIPTQFAEGGPGWAPLKMRHGRPLMDRGVLRDSWSLWRIERNSLRVGTQDIRGRVHQEGATIVPRAGKFLAIPLSPPLTSTQARAGNPRSYTDAFVLMKGPEGPGIYRRKGSKGIERIFMFLRSVKIPARPIRWTTRALTGISRLWVGHVVEKPA